MKQFGKNGFKQVCQGHGFSKRVYLEQNGHKISYWHDVELMTDQIDTLRMGVEIPRYSLGKMEVSLNEPFNPILQDTRKNRLSGQNELRYYAQFGLFNYGFLPQTWENVDQQENQLIAELKGLQGDDDPLDVIEMGTKQFHLGQIIDIKILGSLCLIDQGEIDWKVIAINSSQSHIIKSIADLEKGRIQSIFDWFRRVKTFDGKKENEIYKNKIFGVDETFQVINENHQQWKQHKQPSKQHN